MGGIHENRGLLVHRDRASKFSGYGRSASKGMISGVGGGAGAGEQRGASFDDCAAPVWPPILPSAKCTRAHSILSMSNATEELRPNSPVAFRFSDAVGAGGGSLVCDNGGRGRHARLFADGARSADEMPAAGGGGPHDRRRWHYDDMPCGLHGNQEPTWQRLLSAAKILFLGGDSRARLRQGSDRLQGSERRSRGYITETGKIVPRPHHRYVVAHYHGAACSLALQRPRASWTLAGAYSRPA